MFKQKLGYSVQLRKEQNVAVIACRMEKMFCPILRIEQHLGGRNLRGTWTWNYNCFSQRFVSEEELKSVNFQLLFSSAESALDMKFLNTLNLM